MVELRGASGVTVLPQASGDVVPALGRAVDALIAAAGSGSRTRATRGSPAR